MLLLNCVLFLDLCIIIEPFNENCLHFKHLSNNVNPISNKNISLVFTKFNIILSSFLLTEISRDIKDITYWVKVLIQ